MNELRLVNHPDIIVESITKQITEGTLFSEENNNVPLIPEDEGTEDQLKPVFADSQFIRAKCLVETNKVIHVPKCKAFNVINENEMPYLVRLQPTPTCTCKADKVCCHIMAVQISLGIEIKGQS